MKKLTIHHSNFRGHPEWRVSHNRGKRIVSTWRKRIEAFQEFAQLSEEYEEE